VTEPRTWIAVGDSFTAGTGDDPHHGGWVRRTATALTQAGRITEFRNHAEPGVRLEHVLSRQVPLVTDRADVISAIAGANDLLMPRSAPSTVIQEVDKLLDWALAMTDVVLMTTCPDFFANRSGNLRRLSARVDTLNDHLERRRREAPARVIVVDAHGILADPVLWADDQIHPNPEGHQRLAEAAAALLGHALP
jgi:lysophospholipase L1-like esterase